MDGENLGPIGPWQIRQFPANLRERINAAATEQKISVGEYVTRGMLAYLNGHTASPARLPLPTFAELRDASDALATTATATGRRAPKGIGSRINRAIDDRVRALLGMPPNKPRHPPARIATDSATRIESGVPDSATK